MKEGHNIKESLGRVKAFLKEKAPGLLHKVGEIMPEKGALGIVKNLLLMATPQEISEEDKAKAVSMTEETLKFIEKENEDRHDARAMQIEALKQDDKFSKRFVYYLAAFVIISATAFAFGLFFFSVPEGNKRLIEMFADVYLFGGAVMVLAFFFGSSHSKQNQDRTNSIMNK